MYVGRCDQRGQSGDFLAEVVHALPTLSQPPIDILVRHLYGIALQFISN
jgi:hypothetical protein